MASYPTAADAHEVLARQRRTKERRGYIQSQPLCENASNHDPNRMLCMALINQVNRLAGWGHVSREK